VALGSVLPDIDYPHSPIGRLVKLPFNLDPRVDAVGRYPWHRKFTHTLAFALVIAASGFVFPTYAMWLWCMAIGCTTHILADALTPWGVPLLWPVSPLKDPVSLAGIGVGSQAESLVAASAWLVVALIMAPRVFAWLR
ncbi:membrane protein containing DUF457, transmembrane, partial [mine drainage metagenome]